MSYRAPKISGTNGISVAYGSPGITVSGQASQAVACYNIAFSYNGGTGTFTVHSADGTAFSASNPGYVTFQDKNNISNCITVAVTANQDFIDDVGASEIINNLFGLTTGIAAASAIPFFLYAVVNDAYTAVSFMISRFPAANTSPVNTNIGTPASAIADNQGSFFALESITVTDYDSNPCVPVGCFRMTMSASDDWTVTTLNTNDGVGKFHVGRQFSGNRGQFGAATSKFFKNNGGTAPDDADGVLVYYVNFWDRTCQFYLAFPSFDTAGVGAVNLQLALPMQRFDGANFGTGDISNGAGTESIVSISTAALSNSAEFIYVNAGADGTLQNSSMGIGSAMSISGRYVVWSSP